MDPGLRRDDSGGWRGFGANQAVDATLATDIADEITLAAPRFRDSKMRKILRWSLSMRVPTLASLMIVIGLMAAPAWAQTYDPRYPVCLQVSAIDGSYIDCSYASPAQCAASASGRSAECIVNPYFANRQMPAGQSYPPRRGR